jgi:hypothetical protein
VIDLREAVVMSRGPELFVWLVTETAGFEAAWIELDGLALRVEGRAVGQLPEPYWLSYALETDERAATTRLQVTAATAVAENVLDLRRSGEGWTVNGDPRAELAGALDCDLACSPVTNTMPIIRHRLHREAGSQRFTMAFVQVPTLPVLAVPQQYIHLGRIPEGARVRYSSGRFSSDLVVDDAGLVLSYPTMAKRIDPESDIGASDRVGGPGSPRPGAG